MTHNHFPLLLLWITCLGFLPNPNRLPRLSSYIEVAQAPSSSIVESRYDRLMAEGYEATEQRDYQTALQKFQQALAQRPNDAYAQQAVSNIKTYLKQDAADESSWIWGKLGLLAIALGGAGIIVFLWKFRSPSSVEADDPSIESDSLESHQEFNARSIPTEHKQNTAHQSDKQFDSHYKPPDASSWHQQANRLPNLDLVNELIKDLQEPNARIRHRAIQELTQRGDSRAVKPLVELIIQANSLERSLVLEALTQISMRTLQPMNQALTDSIQDESAQVRTNAIRELSQVYDLMSQVNQLLSHATEDSDAEVQEIARRALNQMTLNQLLFNADT